MGKESISHLQLGTLFFVFMTGSAIINIPGPLIGRAGNGAWISLLLSAAGGFVILSMLLYLYKRFPELTYVEYSRKLIGNALTIVFGLMSISFLLQMQSAIVIDVGLFMISSMLRETPMYAFTFLIFMISGLTARAGIEVIARMFTIIMLATSFSISIVLILAIPDYHPSYLLPVLPKGIKPVVHGAVFTFGFPYVEVFLFGMIIPFVAKNKRKHVPKSMYMALSINLCILIAATVGAIMVFGPYAAERQYVLFSMARLVEFQEIIQRIESIIGMSLILGSYMKATITLYVLSLFFSRLFQIQDNTTIAMPLALLGFLMGLVTFNGSTQWGGVVTTFHPVWASFVFLIPLLTVTVAAILRKGVK